MTDKIAVVSPGLIVSGISIRGCREILEEYRIVTVVSVMSQEQHLKYDSSFPIAIDGLMHYRFNFGDSDLIHPVTMFEMLAAMENVPCLLHCLSGQNRSTAVALCWIMLHEKCDLASAMTRYQSARGKLMPPIIMTCEMRASVDAWIEAARGLS